MYKVYFVRCRFIILHMVTIFFPLCCLLMNSSCKRKYRKIFIHPHNNCSSTKIFHPLYTALFKTDEFHTRASPKKAHNEMEGNLVVTVDKGSSIWKKEQLKLQIIHNQSILPWTRIFYFLFFFCAKNKRTIA